MTRRELTTRLPLLGLLLAAGITGILLAANAGGAGAGLLAAVAVASAVALVVRSAPASVDAHALTSLFDGALLILPGALTVYFAFDSGGYFPASPAFVAIVLLVVLVLRVTLVEEPFAGFSPRVAIAGAALAGFAVWVLASAIWSNADARALVEFDRAFMYLLILVLFGSLARSSTRLRWMAGSVAAGVVVVAVAALATRLAPDHFHTAATSIGSGLAYPLTYSNALGILCVLGGILALYFTTSTREPLPARVAGAAALPVLATAVYLTLSRGPVAAAFIGLGAYLLIGRPRGLLPALIAVVPTSVIAVASAYHHPVLTQRNPSTDALASAGHDVALVVALCAAGAGLLRLLAAPLDSAIASFSLPPRTRRPVIAAAWAAGVLVVVAVALAAHAPSRLSDQYHRFVDTAEAGPGQDVRASVFNPDSRGLIDNWSVALKAFGDRPFDGQGAGTYEVYWYEHRPAKQAGYPVTDGHSLYLETLGELGIVGFLLLATVVVSILAALLRIRRRRNHTLYAALFAVALAWAVHAGVDWDWEMPAVTAGVIALGAAAMAAHRREESRNWPSQSVRVTIGVLLLAGLAAPVLLFSSQRQLDDSLDAVRAGNCRVAMDRADASIRTLSSRPDPYEALAICDQRLGRTRFGVLAMQRAVARDPDNWRYHYELAVLQGGVSINPRPELVTAHRLNPTSVEVNTLLADLPEGSGANWEIELQAPPGASPVVQR
jgi:O-Antigen ligase